MLDPRNEHNTHVSDSYGGYTAMNFGPKARKTAQNYENYRNFNGGGVQFRPNEPVDESGVCSPPLWRTSPPQSPVHALVPNKNYRHLSPTSRAQAIARGQWELMEMVKNMPESSYELSLKDLVEHNRVQDDYSKKECLVDGKNLGGEKGYQRVKSKGKEMKGKMINRSGSGSMDHNKGLFLHMAFPFSMGSKKKKKNLGKTNAFAKVSPKPEGENKFSKGGEKDWWKKRFSTSESGVTSSNSGSTGSSGSSGSSSSSSRSNSRR